MFIYDLTTSTLLGDGIYSLSLRVMPCGVRLQHISQENPCPGDLVELTCIRSESSPAAVRWTADGEPLYTFGIPMDIGTPNANHSHIVGLIGVIINETTLTLMADLKNATFMNGTKVICGDIIRGNSSQPIIFSIIGKHLSCSLPS